MTNEGSYEFREADRLIYFPKKFFRGRNTPGGLDEAIALLVD